MINNKKHPIVLANRRFHKHHAAEKKTFKRLKIIIYTKNLS